MNFQKPTQESDYFKGIIRSTKAYAKATTELLDYPNKACAVLQSNFAYFWHSSLSNDFSDYIEIGLPFNTAKVTSYLISSGNNGEFYLVSWALNCSLDGKHWTTIDSHKGDATFTASKQKKIYDTKIVKECRIFRFVMNGAENINRNYMYVGPVEFYGTLYNKPMIQRTTINCNSKNSFLFFTTILTVS